MWVWRGGKRSHEVLEPLGARVGLCEARGREGWETKNLRSCRLDGDPRALTTVNSSPVCCLNCCRAASDKRRVAGRRVPVERAAQRLVGWMQCVSHGRCTRRVSDSGGPTNEWCSERGTLAGVCCGPPNALECNHSTHIIGPKTNAEVRERTI